MDRWPKLRVDDWTDTRETLHMWLQIVGKIQMVSTPLVNHWWNVTFEVSARGLRTRLLRTPTTAFDMEFDFVDHQLVLRSTSGATATVALEPKTVAEFFAQTQAALAQVGGECLILASPNEVSPAIPFAQDITHKSYDAAAVTAFWGQLVSIEQVFSAWRSSFAGKDSPVQLFWGSLDLSITRYSGRGAPPHTGAPANCPPWVMTEAESRENAAAGFWAGGSAEGTFYAYAYPEPAGYREGDLAPGRFDSKLGEWVLDYQDVRTSSDPDQTLLDFLNGTYALVADLASWDRSLLEVDPHRLDTHIYHGAKPQDW